MEKMKYSSIPYHQKWKVRNQLKAEQDGNCLHCGFPLDGEPTEEIKEKDIDWSLFPPNFLQAPVHLHHCHTTDRVLGVVHAQCNAVLWQYHQE